MWTVTSMRESSSTEADPPLFVRRTLATWARHLGRVARHPIFWWALLGTAIRVGLAPFTSWTADVEPYYFAARDLATYGNPYATMHFTYPPLFAYLAFPLEYLVMITTAPVAQFVPAIVPVSELTGLLVPVVTSPAFNLAVKIPMILADFLTGWLLYAVLAPRSPAEARRAFLLWYLNPLVILVGSVQGQLDVLPAMFVLVASLALVERQRWIAGVAIAAAIALKLYAALLIPLFAAALLADLQPEVRSLWAALRRIIGPRTRRELVTFLGIVVLSVMLFIAPSAGAGLRSISRRAAVLQPGGFSGPSLFFQLTGSGLLTFASSGSRPEIISWALLVAMVFAALYLAVKHYPFLWSASSFDGLLALTAGTVLTLIAVFVFSPLVNPQYLVWVLPSLVLLGSRWRTFERSLVLLSFAGVIFEVGLLGWAAYLYPLAVYTGAVSVPWLNEQITAYWFARGLISPRLSQDISLLGTAMGMAALGWMGVRAVGLTRARRRK